MRWPARPPIWLAGRFGTDQVAEWELRHAARIDSWRLPSSQTKRDRLAQVYGDDALTLLRAVWAPDAPAWLCEIEAIGLLRQVVVQIYHVTTDARGGQVIRKRGADTPDTNTGTGTGTGTEASPAQPNLITDVATTVSTAPDVTATAQIQQRLTERQVKPGEHYLDSGYPSADLVVAAARQDITMVTPLPADRSRQARTAEGFDKAAFRIDGNTRQVHCPEDRTSTGWYPVQQHGRDAIAIEFARSDCGSCPSRDPCTTAAWSNRMLTPRPRELHEATAADRAAQKTDTRQAEFALRAGVEGTINQALDITGLRRARYRGLPKVTLQHVFSAAAINIVRLDAH
ncbi:transposase [Streptomyces cellostaticus]|uniref:transposase n=1 Tax=Streptomyces cellostaticus TaxID=67285 RepID=UPI00082F090E|nr:transposase [Streptomyces cellostaticus]GHI10252.1 hypothetical protein Scel_85730 [Streptomyces cellostaticus]